MTPKLSGNDPSMFYTLSGLQGQQLKNQAQEVADTCVPLCGHSDGSVIAVIGRLSCFTLNERLPAAHLFCIAHTCLRCDVSSGECRFARPKHSRWM
eukprot:1036763-Pelagomonas_calceolata.AAC.6